MNLRILETSDQNILASNYNEKILKSYDDKVVNTIKRDFHNFYEEKGSFYSFDFPLTTEWGEAGSLQKYACEPLRYALYAGEEPIGLFQGIVKKRSLVSTLEAGSESGNGISIHPAFETKALKFFLTEILKKNRFSYISIFSPEYIEIPGFLTKKSYTYYIYLTKPIEVITSRMERKCRRAIKKAQKNQVQVEITDQDEALYEAYKVMLEGANSRDFIIPHFDLIKTLHKNFQKSGHSISVIARHNGEPISASYLFGYDGKLNWFISGSKPIAFKLQAGNLIQIEIIKWAKSNGYRIYDMGGTDPYNLRYALIDRFKSSFGGELVTNYVVYKEIFYMPLLMKIKALLAYLPKSTSF